jgi:hypothetical protein
MTIVPEPVFGSTSGKGGLKVRRQWESGLYQEKN